MLPDNPQRVPSSKEMADQAYREMVEALAKRPVFGPEYDFDDEDDLDD